MLTQFAPVGGNKPKLSNRNRGKLDSEPYPLANRASSFVWSVAHGHARAPIKYRDPRALLGGAAYIVDWFCIFLPAWLMGSISAASSGNVVVNLYLSIAAALLCVNIFLWTGSYAKSANGSLGGQLGRACIGWTVALTAVASLALATGLATNPLRLVLWCLTALTGLAMVRVGVMAAVAVMRRRGLIATTAAVVDLTGNGVEFARKLRESSQDLYLAGYFLADDLAPPGKRIEDLIGLTRLFRVDDVFVRVALDTPEESISDVLQRLANVHTRVHVCPSMPQLDVVALHDAGIVHGAFTLTAQNLPVETWGIITKRVEDIVIGLVALVLALPLMALTAIAIKLDSRGPILYRQARHGFNNNTITVYKFRTMKYNTAGSSTAPVIQATKDDPRITRVGKILRKTSIDELPQLFNVLKGDMSLVGPRPHAVSHNEHYSSLIEEYLGRHRVQPGITGWAQVNGYRGETEVLEKMQKRIEHDLYYVNNWSVLFDLRILAQTAWCIVVGRNAY